MTKPKTGKKPPAGSVLTVTAEKGETEADTMARVIVSPFLRHGCLGHGVAAKAFGKLPSEPDYNDFGKAIKARAKAAAEGDLTLATEILVSQALSLDAMFAELARRSVMNFGDYPLAAERYARLAFKAQSNSRASLEALAKLHQPREQTVRHVHVNEGGQAVIADNVHHHGGGKENENSNGQPHTTNTAGTSSALLGQDAEGNGLPISSSEGQPAMPNARRQRKRRT
ncbi:hypothetical protein [Aurantiacibacter atlanticus]|uniref:hypothetical protein n=1 Tax=Aurantiacibacter atlanticus TaxID=1648404 RepID=UPI00069DF427|nr:hypothetical protein [Aurantiacibacter atlanticus]